MLPFAPSGHIYMMRAQPASSDIEPAKADSSYSIVPFFEQVVRQNIDWLYALALRQTRAPADAEDVTQAVFILLFRKADRIHGPEHLAPWLFHSAMLICRDVKKQRQRREIHERKAAEMRLATTPDPETPSDLSCALDDAITQLRDSDRRPILPRYFQGLSHQQIGEVMGITEEAAKMRISRAIQKLRTKLNGSANPVSASVIEMTLVASRPQAPAALFHRVMATSKATGTVAAAGAAWIPVVWPAAIIIAATLVVVAASASIERITAHRAIAAATSKPIAHAVAPAPQPEHQYFVYGNVINPGVYMVPPTTVRQAILMARGLERPADANTFIQVIHRNAHQTKEICVYRYQPLMNPVPGLGGNFPLDRKIGDMDMISVTGGDPKMYGKWSAPFLGPIAAGDLLMIAVADLDQAGATSDLRVRVSATGNVTIPQIGDIKLIGQTMPQAEQTIRQIYAKANVIPSALVSVGRILK